MCARATFALLRWIRGYTSRNPRYTMNPRDEAAYRIKPFSAKVNARYTHDKDATSPLHHFAISFSSNVRSWFIRESSFLSILFLQFSLAKEIIRGGKVLFRFFFFKRRFRMNEVILTLERKLRRFSREFSIRGCVECFGIVICTGKNILSLLLSSK